jgi:ZIP family zinc transporter
MGRPVWIVVPLVLLAAVVAWLLLGRPLADLAGSAPPVEELVVERAALTPGMVTLDVRGDGSSPITIAQVQVDAAWRVFTATPSATVGRLGATRLAIPYPWVEGEAHHIVLLTSTGAAFEHTIDVAVPQPDWQASLGVLVLVGLLLGIVPVTLGLLAYPAMRSFGPTVMSFVLALTVGLLLFLFVDTITEGLEKGAETLGRLRGTTVVFVAAALTALALLAIGRRGGTAPEGVRLAFFIALGIGLHNLGEGLVVGAALAAGAASLATFLVVGFVIHNVTEGVGIAAPMVSTERPSLAGFAGLAALAGLPATVGVVIGTQAVNPYWMAVCFGIGAGAILQVMIEVAAFLIRRDGSGALTRPAGAGGVIAGLAIMYATALLV